MTDDYMARFRKLRDNNPCERFKGNYSSINAIADGFVYGIDDLGLCRHTTAPTGSEKFSRDFAEPVKDYLKRNNLSLENIQSVKAEGKTVVYTWENDALIFSLRSQTWNKQ
jgi:hypothetical protein